MAKAADYDVVTFQRRPGLWRASITLKAGAAPSSKKGQMLGFLTEEDYDSEANAEIAAAAVIKNIE
jgi:hypothetical protein